MKLFELQKDKNLLMNNLAKTTRFIDIWRELLIPFQESVIQF